MRHPFTVIFAKLREAVTVEVAVSVISALFIAGCITLVASIARRKRLRTRQDAMRQVKALYESAGRAVVRRDPEQLPQVKHWKDRAEWIAEQSGITLSEAGVSSQKWDKWIAMAREKMPLIPPSNAPNAPANVLNPDEPGTPAIPINGEEEFFTITVEEPPPSADGEPEEWSCREPVDDEFIVEAGKKLDAIMAEQEFQKELSSAERIEQLIAEAIAGSDKI